MTLHIHRYLRISFLLTWAVAWNALLGAGLVLDLQLGVTRHTYFGAMFIVATLGTAAACLGVLFAPRMQVIALRAGVGVAVVRRDLWFLVVLTASLGVMGGAGLMLYTNWGSSLAMTYLPLAHDALMQDLTVRSNSS